MKNNLLSKFAFWQKKHNRVDLGVYINTDGMTVYQAESLLRQIPLIKQDWRTAFQTLVEQVPGANIQIVLSSDYYQLLVVDKPAVDDEEIGQALQWSIKDMVSKPIAELHFDYFESPQANNNKLTVVVVDRQVMTALALAAQQCDVAIAGISIEEMAISNLSENENLAKLVLSHEPNHELKLTVIKRGALYMQRSVRGFNQIDVVTADDLRLGVADNLSLELQRSMDYFESQLRQAPVASIELLMGGAKEELARLLSANFDQQVNTIPCQHVADKFAELAFAEFNHDRELEVA
ncbi:MSHA biogenesis protein MshI [Shewanella psychrotolerans]|uniref:MSHA biogenesis protein MshI n=1 Tax=Shewanella psychrotolerans TaxID=2864206 RepID=UPI001C65F962|nr:MSHA biogenesis protein MshI [Shewanella psychrotolerans]QYK01788.1 MSHA biogenesis protein MshI [Shewanella psychrotolerans]